MAQNNQPNYGDHWISKDKLSEKIYASLDGWVRLSEKNGPVLKGPTELIVNGTARRVVEMTLSVVMTDNQAKFIGCTPTTNPYKSYFVDVRIWNDRVIDRIMKYQPVSGQLLSVMGTVTVDKYEKKDGSPGEKISVIAQQFVPRSPKPSADGEKTTEIKALELPDDGSSVPDDEPDVVADSALAQGRTVDEDGFIVLDDNQDLPF